MFLFIFVSSDFYKLFTSSSDLFFFNILGYSSLANPPECIRPFPSEVTINEGERAEVDCTILGNPRPKVQWVFNGRQIKSNAEFVEVEFLFYF